MNTKRNIFVTGYWIVTLLAFAVTLTMLVTYTPIERTMGPVQKVFYIHLPVAINMFLAATVMFIACVGYLWQRRMWWDDLAASAGQVTALSCSVVLLTGIIWGKTAWGHWWTWSPRLTLSLILWLLYVVYLMIRPAIESPHRRAVVCAVYGIAAFLDVPLVYLSVRLMPQDVHPQSIGLAPEMKLTLLAWFVPVTLLMVGLIVARFKLNQRVRQLTAEVDTHASPRGAAVGIGEPT